MKEKISIPFLAGAKYENKIYFSSLYINGLFKYDCKTYKCELIKIFDEKRLVPMLHRKAVIYGDEIWFMPWEAKKIAKYNITQNKIYYYEIPSSNNELLYFDLINKNNQTYFVPYKFNTPIAIINGNTSNLKFMNGITEIEDNMISKIAGAGIVENDLLVVLQDGSVLENLNKKWTKILENNNSDTYSQTGYLTLVNTETSMWLCPFEGNCVVEVDKIYRKIKNYINVKGKRYSYGNIIHSGIVMFPTEKNREFLILKENNIINKYIDFNMNDDLYLEMNTIGNSYKDSILISSNQGNVCEYDLEMNLKNKYNIEMNRKEYMEQFVNKLHIDDLKKDYTALESDYYDFKMFLGIISKKENLYEQD